MIFLWDWNEAFLTSLDTLEMLSDNDGLKFRQSPRAAVYDKFNVQITQRDLERRIFKEQRPFAIDRGVGGSNYDPYPWDESALRKVEAALGDKFLGIQMHEWIGNTSTDVRLIREHGIGAVTEGTYAVRPRLQYGMKAHYSTNPLPLTAEQFLECADSHFQRKLMDFRGYTYLVEGHDQSYARGFSLGARAGFAEIGRQVPLARMQVACLRGTARCFNKPWGMYYEPWSHASCTHYSTSSLWRLPKSRIPHDPTLGHGGHFGSSRALQRQLLYYSLICGAHFYAEEYGYENTFWNPAVPELTPYGQILKEAVEINRKRDFGTPWKPVLIAIDDIFWPLRNRDLFAGAFSGWGTFDISQPAAPVPDLLQACFLRSDWKQRQETYERHDEWKTLPSSPFPDVFDIVPASLAGKRHDYELTLYCGEDAEQAKRIEDNAGKMVWVNQTGVERALKEVRHLLYGKCPLQVDGDVFVTLNRTEESWLIGLFNPFGVSRAAESGDVLDTKEMREVSVHLQQGIQFQEEWIAGQESVIWNGTKICLTVPPGGVRLLQVQRAKSMACDSKGL